MLNSCISGISAYNIHRLQWVQNCLARVVQHTHSAIMSYSLLASLCWLPISQRVTFKLACLVYRSLHDTYPANMSTLLHAYAPIWSLRSSSNHLLVKHCLWTTLASRGLRSAGPRIWNSVPNHIKLLPLSSLSDLNSNSPLHFNSSITGNHAICLRLWFEITFDFECIINWQQYITYTTLPYLMIASCRQTTVLLWSPMPIEKLHTSGKSSTVLCIRKRKRFGTGGNIITLKWKKE